MYKKTFCGVAAVLLIALAFAWQAPAQKDDPAPQRGPGQGGPIPDPDPPGPEKVNVVLIIADDVGVDQVLAYADGYEDLQSPILPHPDPCTPALDALAEQGVRFTNAWSNPLCSPTRSLIMTGKRAFCTGMGSVTNPQQQERVGLREDQFSLADLNVKSAAVGKWHLCDESQTPDHPINGLGFDYFSGCFYNLTNCQDSPDYYDWQIWDGIHWNPERRTDYATIFTTEEAIRLVDQLEQDSGDDPWFLWLAYHAAHQPFHCPDELDCPTSPSGCEHDWCADCGTYLGPEDYPERVKKTRAMVHVMDDQIGQLLSYIEDEFNQNDDYTVVIFIGDNGTPGGYVNATYYPFNPNHAKATVYQGGVNVPLIIYDPRVERDPQDPSLCHELVSATDLFATVAEFLGESYVEDGHDSKSLASYVNSGYQAGDPRETVYAERFEPTFIPESGGPPSDFVPKYHYRAVRNATHKLIERREPGEDPEYEFYRLYDANLTADLPHDPAWLDDPGAHPWASPFEEVDLEDLQSQWVPGVDDVAHAELLEQLVGDDQHGIPPTYPTFDSFGYYTEVEPATVVSATRFGSNSTADCSDEDIHIRYTENGPYNWTARAFFEFDLRPFFRLNDDVTLESVELDVAVMDGGAWYTHVEVRPLQAGMDVSSFFHGVNPPEECGNLFDSPTGDVFAEEGGWVRATPFEMTFKLSGAAIDSITAGLAVGDSVFSFALKLEREETAFADEITLFDADGQFWDPCGVFHSLRLAYTESGKQSAPMPAPFRQAAKQQFKDRLGQSYPNPFNPTTTIEYSLKEQMHVSLCIYNVAGQLVRTLVDEVQSAGDNYRVVWDGRNNTGETVTSGVYFYRLRAGDFLETRKTILLK